MNERIDITLTGEKAVAFMQVVEDIENQRGYSPTRPEVIGELIGEYNR